MQIIINNVFILKHFLLKTYFHCNIIYVYTFIISVPKYSYIYDCISFQYISHIIKTNTTNLAYFKHKQFFLL